LVRLSSARASCLGLVCMTYHQVWAAEFLDGCATEAIECFNTLSGLLPERVSSTLTDQYCSGQSVF
jgi:hypothetical protein